MEGLSRGYSGAVNAPTGSGKTYALYLGALMTALRQDKLLKKGRL